MNHIDISRDDVRCTITTPGPLPAEAWPLVERLYRTVAEVAVALAELSGVPTEDGPEPRPAPLAKPNPSDEPAAREHG